MPYRLRLLAETTRAIGALTTIQTFSSLQARQSCIPLAEFSFKKLTELAPEIYEGLSRPIKRNLWPFGARKKISTDTLQRPTYKEISSRELKRIIHSAKCRARRNRSAATFRTTSTWSERRCGRLYEPERDPSLPFTRVASRGLPEGYPAFTRPASIRRCN